MNEWWKRATAEDLAARRRAVAYYRHSAEIGQENSVEIQQDNVVAFAKKHAERGEGERMDDIPRGPELARGRLKFARASCPRTHTAHGSGH